jgi:hypothetical protein
VICAALIIIGTIAEGDVAGTHVCHCNTVPDGVLEAVIVVKFAVVDGQILVNTS